MPSTGDKHLKRGMKEASNISAACRMGLCSLKATEITGRRWEQVEICSETFLIHGIMCNHPVESWGGRVTVIRVGPARRIFSFSMFRGGKGGVGHSGFLKLEKHREGSGGFFVGKHCLNCGSC